MELLQRRVEAKTRPTRWRLAGGKRLPQADITVRA
jgi:hypothetical protein